MTLRAYWVDDLVYELKGPCPGMSLSVDADEDFLELRYIRVPVGSRGQGHGTRSLGRLCEEADRHGLVLVCTPTDEYGADRARLEAWYRRHGFTPGAAPRTVHTWARTPAVANRENTV